jgi:heptosyltransferase-2
MVTQVSMMMHIALGLKIPLVLFNNIFNKHEFELYDNGIILEPLSGCDCYFGNTCKREKSCMFDLPPDFVFEKIEQLLVR